MPTYDYQCGLCGHRFELFQSITARPARKCPGCGRQKAKRLIGTGAGIIFRGSGFYETDYRSESYKKAAKSDSEAASGSKKGESGDGGSKSDSKSDGKSAKIPGDAK
ncbi:MAG TPA: zinc ribbon domain-containing protein [Phycisphaerae bacterium]|nr:zinc ribbon domain-containing protein [Phycisphaerae bacterium]